jgi:dTDP-4-amino-4,6-dideoxygalactose transaminase
MRLQEILDRRRSNCRRLYEQLHQVGDLVVPQYQSDCALTRLFVRTPGLRWEWSEGQPGRPHPLAEYLARRGIQTQRPYTPLHWQPDLAGFAKGPLPRTEQIVPELIALPVQGPMSESTIDEIAAAIRGFFGG